MTMQELGTMMEQGLPIKIFILNNSVLGMVRQIQEFYYQARYMAVNFKFHPDFAALARAYSIPGYTVQTEEELQKVLPEVLATPGPALVNCLTPADENVTP
ncbi:thiamine pyrophosphate-dependent enzyme, partial [Bradyrhizobium sp. Ce-3]